MPKEKIFETTVQAPTKVNPVTGLLVSIIAICSVMMLGVFGAGFVSNMAGLVNGTATSTAICVDYDAISGINPVVNSLPAPLVKGWTYDTISDPKFNPSQHNPEIAANADYCTLKGVRVSSCSGADCGLMERYCANSRRNSRYYIYNGTAGYNRLQEVCPLGCSDGACKPEPVCVDSDIKSSGGDDLFMQGFTMGLNASGTPVSTTDYCVQNSSLPDVRATSGPWVMEYGCANNRVQGGLVSCAEGCFNGACKQPSMALVPGDVIKSATNSSIYFYGSDKKKHLFPTPGIYNSWFGSGNGVKVISNAQLDSLPLGANMKVRPVGYIVKFGGSSKYYAALPDGSVQPFANSSVISNLYGASWSGRVINIPTAFEANYPKISSIIGGTSTWPNGLLVQYNLAGSVGSVYYIQSGKKRPITSGAFTANRLPSNLVISSFGRAYPTGTSIIGQEAIFVKPY